MTATQARAGAEGRHGRAVIDPQGAMVGQNSPRDPHPHLNFWEKFWMASQPLIDTPLVKQHTALHPPK